MNLYQQIFRPILFATADPEWIHGRFMASLRYISRQQSVVPPNFVARAIASQLQTRFCFRDERLQQTLWGLTFPNPLGLAAGFDKNGEVGELWGSLGFGFAELGTVTWHSQPGNPPPRLFRLIEDQAALNRMGFNNCGANGMAQNLTQVRSPQLPQIPIGVNLGKSKVTALEEATGDYRDSFEVLQGLGDYFVVNVSSPNTPGLRSLQAPERLEQILKTLMDMNADAKPILVKIAPDLETGEIRAILDQVLSLRLGGVIATNTTISRSGLKTQRLAKTGKSLQEEAGGISGAPLKARSTEVIREIWHYTEGKLPIIGTGGVASAEDAWEKITAGASLLEVYTGWIYEGPGLPKQVLSGLVEKLEDKGLSRIQDAVGLAHRA
ncbi:quinone-dependent dihydroorotate dehydrogenase [Geitlerinema sp. P-1104]|uniref:quinone-dependent dihydroorotate dehydrogenase n=1 Tax=Geitlerinema sp. P-1104 TaxID=2546230 RepID=UPI0014769665|nr:quinone-dependent dihydroorotate dehydrogenase [Geitlerinema sp. P-1104]NMG57407.1 quinone-dependent dihydroorotate dehydrogenase [Geitlerinema sp. P-1104]